MLSFPPAVHIWLALAPADLRKGFDALAELVGNTWVMTLSGHVFVFRNRRGDRIKLLYWDRDGFVIVCKRLEAGVFRFPAAAKGQAGVTVRAAEWAMLLDGVDWQKRQAVEALQPAGDSDRLSGLRGWRGLSGRAAGVARLFLAPRGTNPVRNASYEALQHWIDLLLRRMCRPPRGERFNPNPLLLFAEMDGGQDTASPTEPAPLDNPKRRCRPHGRRRLPENLPREPRHHQLSEAERVCQGCNQLRIDIGVDKSEQLDYRPASLFVVEHVVHKYICPCCGKRPSQSQRQQAQPAQESEPMPSRELNAQPPPPTEPLPAQPEQLGDLLPDRWRPPRGARMAAPIRGAGTPPGRTGTAAA